MLCPVDRTRPTRRRRRELGRALACLVVAAWPGCRPEPDAAIPDPYPIEVTGADFRWHVRYPGRDGIPGNSDDFELPGDLHVPVGTTIEIGLDSKDFIYAFRIPDFGVNQMAVPNLDFGARFRADEVREHALQGDQMCGFQHPDLLKSVRVHERGEYRVWLAEAARRVATAREQGDR